jgi:hypothetical protein
MPHQWHGNGNGKRIEARSRTDSTVMARRNFARTQPTREGIHEDGRQTLALLRACSQTVNVVLVALTDAVELEIWADGSLRRRSRFLRDTEARKYSDRLTARLLRRGYRKEAELFR